MLTYQIHCWNVLDLFTFAVQVHVQTHITVAKSAYLHYGGDQILCYLVIYEHFECQDSFINNLPIADLHFIVIVCSRP